MSGKYRETKEDGLELKDFYPVPWKITLACRYAVREVSRSKRMSS